MRGPIYDKKDSGKETVYPLHLPCPRCTMKFRVGQIIHTSNICWPSPSSVSSRNLIFIGLYRRLGVDLTRIIINLIKVKYIPMNVHRHCEEINDTRCEFLIYSPKNMTQIKR
jgi:hypothetical protein